MSQKRGMHFTTLLLHQNIFNMSQRIIESTDIPGSAAGTPFRTLTAVLSSIAPELLDHPEVIAQIKDYLGRLSSQPSDHTLRQLLLPYLSDPKKEKVSHLMTALDGMRILRQDYGLDDAQQMDAFFEFKKAQFEIFIQQELAKKNHPSPPQGNGLTQG